MSISSKYSDPESPVGITKETSISVRKQVNHIIYLQKPTQRALSNMSISVSENYEEKRYTGHFEQLVNFRDSFLETIVIPEDYKDPESEYYSAQTTLTSINGGLWELTIRKAEAYYVQEEDDEDDEEEDPSDDSGAWDGGDETATSSAGNIVTCSTSIQAVPILTHPSFKDLKNNHLALAAISHILNGGSPADEIENPDHPGEYVTVSTAAPSNWPEFKTHPTFNMLVTNVTLQKTIRHKPKIDTKIGTEAWPKGFHKGKHMTSTYVGSGWTYEPSERAWKITSNFRIISWPEDPFEELREPVNE